VAPAGEDYGALDITDAVIVADEPLQEWERELLEHTPAMISPAQTRMMGALMKSLGIVKREDALAYCADVIRRDVATRNELTSAEASAVLESLTADQGARDAADTLDIGGDAA
jgi:hypothetical protein